MFNPQDIRRGFKLGEFAIHPLEGRLVGPKGARHLQPKSAEVLVCLASHAGELVERNDLLKTVWGERAVSDEPLTRCIGDLRRLLDDRREKPTYIETVPKRGYRLVATVDSLNETAFSERSSLSHAAVSIAVLPFDNMSGDTSQAYLGDGIAEEITNALASVQGLEVAARTSSYALKAKELSTREIAETLGVTHLLEGSLRKSADRIRVSARLIRTDTGYHQWGQSFDRQFTDIFDLQDDIAYAVVGELGIALGLESTDGRLARSGTSNVTAYDWFLRGLSDLRFESDDAEKRAIRCFRRAIEIDPAFARAWGYLAVAISDLCLWQPYAELSQSVRDAYETALRLNPNQVEALIAKADDRAKMFGDYAGAEKLYRKALSLDPNNIAALMSFGTTGLMTTNRFKEGIKVMDSGAKLDPLNVGFLHAKWHMQYSMGQMSDAWATCQTMRDLSESFWTYHSIAMMYAAWTDCRTPELRQSILDWARATQNPWGLYGIALVNYADQKFEDVRNTLREMKLASEHAFGLKFLIGDVLARLGEVHDAVDWFENAFADLEPFVLCNVRSYYRNNEQIWNYDRYQRLLKRMNVDDRYLSEHGFIGPNRATDPI